jgi:diamine N-acetyltransferase
MILKRIDESNFLECFHLKLGNEQDKFVSHPIRSLAQAYVYYNQCTPFGIYDSETMVGYVMIIYDYDDETYNIWHLMIDEKYQGKGYGTEAIRLCIDYISSKPFGPSADVVITCNVENVVGIHIYSKYGFQDTGERDEDEITMNLQIE